MKGQKRWVFHLALVLLSLVGMLALWRSTPYGLGLVNDSATYIEGATNLLAGRGYVRLSGGGEVKPITHFPPLFSILLAGIGLVNGNLLACARLLIVLLFGTDIYLVGLSVYKISHSEVFACLGALLLAVSDLHLGVYSFALSEPLFITLMLAAFLLLAESLQKSHWVWPLMAGFLLSLAYLTRYAGAGLFITALMAVLLLKPPQLLRRQLILLAGALPPILLWQSYNLHLSGAEAIGNRELLWHPISLTTLFEALKNLLTWLAPDDLLATSAIWGRLLSLLSLLVLPALFFWLAGVGLRRFRTSLQGQEVEAGNALAFTLSLHVLVYMAFMVVSISLFDASTPLNDRILSVIYIPEMILFCSGLAWTWKKLGSQARFFCWAAATLVLLLAAFSVKDGYALVSQLGREGQGFAHRGISGSPAILAIRQMPPTLIYSNKPGAIFLLTGRSAYVTPTPDNPVTGQDRAGYLDDLAQMHRQVREGKAILVLFGLRNSQLADEAALFTNLTAGLPLQADYGEITIFGSSP